ncbi:MAG: CoB--CoM heterodisulfide reductase subunit C, partial [Candidatus Hodarchaeota archaeon]
AFQIQTEINDELVQLLRDMGILEIGSCIQCGTCSGGCPSGRRTAIKTRSIVRRVQLGDESVLADKGLWDCSTCYTCYERCPRQLPITDIIVFLRNLAVQKGYTLKEHLDLCKKLYDTGHGVPQDNEKWGKLREAYGLDFTPPTVHSSENALKELQTILSSTGFDKLTSVGKYEMAGYLREIEPAGEKAGTES